MALTALVVALLVTPAIAEGSHVLTLAELLAGEPATRLPRLHAPAGESEARVFVAGEWSRANLEPALAAAFRAEWVDDGKVRRLTKRREARAQESAVVLAEREERLSAALEALRESVEDFRKGSGKEIAERYSVAVEDYVRRWQSGQVPANADGSSPTVEQHPMRTLLVELVLDLGASALAGVEVGDRARYSTLELPGTRRLTGWQQHAASFEKVSAAVLDRLGDSASSGALSKIHGMKWLYGSPAALQPVRALTLSVKAWGDELWASVVVDRGQPDPDGYQETIRLSPAPANLANALGIDEEDSTLVDWRPKTVWRYRQLEAANPDATADGPDVEIPESLGVSDILSTLSAKSGKPVLGLLPVGLEAQISGRLKPRMTLYEAIELLGTGLFGLEAVNSEGGVVLRPRTPTLGPWNALSARATRKFVADARKRSDFGADDLGRYLASLDTGTLGTAEPHWWEACLFREGSPVRSRTASQDDYRLLGALLGLSPQGGAWKYAVAPSAIQALASRFALGGILENNERAGSLLTAAGASASDWSQATLSLVRRQAPAAMRQHGTYRSLVRAGDLADYQYDWQPGYPDYLDPTKLRLVEGKIVELEVRLEFPNGSFVRTAFGGAFAPGRDEVVGIAALSEELRSAIEAARTPPPSPGPRP
jgi:hypothetical protein